MDAARVEVGQECDEVSEGASKAVDAYDNEGVSASQASVAFIPL